MPYVLFSVGSIPVKEREGKKASVSSERERERNWTARQPQGKPQLTLLGIFKLE